MIAIAFVSAWVFVWFFGDATHGYKRFVFQLFLWIIIGVYFVRSWIRQGQTLPMRSWKMKLIKCTSYEAQDLIGLRTALLRYILATLSMMLFGIGFFWRFVDPEKLFLHDRLLKTQIIQLENQK